MCKSLFSLAVLSDSLSFAFDNFTIMYLGVVLCDSLNWMSVSFPWLGKFSAIISSNKFSALLSLSFPSGTTIMWMLVCLILSSRSLNLASFFLTFFYCSAWVISSTLSSRSTIYSFAFSNLLLIPSGVFFISMIIFFNPDWLLLLLLLLLTFSLSSSTLLSSLGKHLYDHLFELFIR